MLFAYYFRNYKLLFSSRGCRGPSRWNPRQRASVKAEVQTTRQLPNTASQAKKTEKPNGATARALRHAGSPQRVRREQDAFARRHSESASTRRISAEGSPRARHIRTAPQRERFDTQDLRKGFTTSRTNSHGTTARALRHAQSPQRVRRAQDTFARRHSESASTRTISTEGSPSSRHIRTAPQRERLDTHNLRRGFAELKTSSHGATARALRHARSPQKVHFRLASQRLQMSETLRLPRNSQTLFPKMLRLPRIICISAKHAALSTKNARQSHRMLRWPWNSAATHKCEDRRGATARAQF